MIRALASAAGGRIFLYPGGARAGGTGMARRRWQAGWARIPENQFKAGVAAAMKAEPDLCERLRRAIRATAARTGVSRNVRDQYLAWIAEVEAATAAMTDAESSDSVPARCC